MSDHKRFPFEQAERLDNDERRQRQPPELLVELIAETGASRVLDIGVGTGYFALEIARKMPGAKIIGLDIEPRMLDVFRDRAVAEGFGDRVEAHQVPPSAPETIPLEDATAGAVLMANLYHEIGKPLRYLREVRRVLVDGGRLVLCDWDPAGRRDAGPPPDYRVPMREVLETLREAGFSRILPRSVYPDFYTFTAE